MAPFVPLDVTLYIIILRFSLIKLVLRPNVLWQIFILLIPATTPLNMFVEFDSTLYMFKRLRCEFQITWLFCSSCILSDWKFSFFFTEYLNVLMNFLLMLLEWKQMFTGNFCSDMLNHSLLSQFKTFPILKTLLCQFKIMLREFFLILNRKISLNFNYGFGFKEQTYEISFFLFESYFRVITSKIYKENKMH